MLGAIAAGNCVIGKPSELTPHTSAAIATLVARFLDPSAVAIVEGGPDATQALLAERVRPHLLHGQRSRRTRRDGSRGAPPHAGHVGARREEPRHRGVRRRRGDRGAPHRLGQVPERGPDLHRARLRPRRGTGVRPLRRSPRRHDPRVLRRRPLGEPRLRPHRRRPSFRGLSDLLADGRIVVGGERDASSRYFAPTVLTESRPTQR